MFILSMFKAVLEDASLFKDSIDSINSLITEGCFNISKDSIGLIAMDPASVAMVIFDFLSSSFKEYSVDEDKRITLNIDQLKSILGRVSSSDSLAIELDDEKHQLILTVSGKSTKKFTLPLLEQGESVNKVPPLEFDTKIELDANTFKEWIKDAAIISDCVVFLTDKDNFKLEASGGNSNVELELGKGSPALHSVSCGSEQTRAKYSLEYLDKIVKSAKIADKITLEYKTDYPARIEFKNLDKLRIAFILAPRVETE